MVWPQGLESTSPLWTLAERLKHLFKVTQQATGRLGLYILCCPKHSSEMTRMYMQAPDLLLLGASSQEEAGSVKRWVFLPPGPAMHRSDSTACHRRVVFRTLSTCVVCPRDRSSLPLGTGLGAFLGLKPPLTPGPILALTPKSKSRVHPLCSEII